MFYEIDVDKKIFMILPPHKDFSLSNRNGEHWADIKELEGYYQISNFGRIKKLPRSVISPGSTRRTKTKIARTQIVKADNKLHGDQTYQLTVTMMVDTIIYRFSIRRLVYYYFVAEFDNNDKNLVVLVKNGNGLDIRPANLELASIGQKVRKSVSTGRMENDFSHVDLKNAVGLSVAVTSKLISSYDGRGKRIATYPSVHYASRILGVNISSLYSAIKGNHRALGLYWAYGQDSIKDLTILKAEKRENFRKLKGKPVLQFSLDGKFIAKFDCLKSAAEAVGCQWTSISAATRGIYKTAGGYTWKTL